MRSTALLLSAAFFAAALPARAQSAPTPIGPTPAAAHEAAQAAQSQASPHSHDDVRVEYRVAMALGRLRGIDLSDVHFYAVRGALTLHGSVETDRARAQVLVAVGNTEGVRVVRDELVTRAAQSARGGGPGDEQIAAQALRLVLADPALLAHDAHVDARGGVVAVSARVATYADALRLVRSLARLAGVRAVDPRFVVGEAHVIDVNADRERHH